ncbi:MAG: FAD-dependent monooxygenase [Synechococcus sp.]
MAASSALTIEQFTTDRDPQGSLSVSISGAGPTGALLALGLARLGCRVDLFDPLSKDQIASRSRAYAITHSSRRLLQRLGLWADLEPHCVPFRRLRLSDQAVAPQVWFGLDDLAPVNRSSGAIGWILDHKPLMQLLIERLQAQSGLCLRLGDECSTGLLISAEGFDLQIACDGPRSPHRRAWGFPLWSMPYRQGCLTMKVLLRGVAPATAYELFRSEGPFAVLPLGGQVFQLVWSAPLDRCRQRAALPPVALLDLLATVLPDGINPDALLDQPMAVPLNLSLAPRLGRGRRLLVGEAGHRCHPVGGQGLNLCWRDVSDLLDLVAMHRDQPSSLHRLVRDYGRCRLPDLVLIVLSTDALLRLFSNRFWPLLPLRTSALWLMQRLPVLRRVCLQAMSDGPMTVVQPLPQWGEVGGCHGVQQ